jgi:light-regulated signal transduction histidine kinase (bacteriophytochrome)
LRKKPTYEALEQKVKALERGALEQKKAKEALKRYAAQLERRHQEVKASVDRALHDFQEPLDVVTSYLRFVDARYKGRLGSDADAFIASAVDGADRLQGLVANMLAYVRTGDRKGDVADDTEYLQE